MKRSRLIGMTTVALAAFAVSSLYLSKPALSSDHQDTYNLGNAVGHNTTADITDVYVFPAPDNANNVVLAMDTAPLTGAGMGTSIMFDPTLIYQFKISHQTSGAEDEVIQFQPVVSSTGAETINVFGPASPNEVSTTNTLITQTGSVPYNGTATQSQISIAGSAVQVFAGPRADPFNFDLLAFFSFLGDRNFQTHTSQSDPGTGDSFANGNDTPGTTSNTVTTEAAPFDQGNARAAAPSFNGFASGTMSNTSTGVGTGYACSTNAATNTLGDFAGGFNVESIVIELPKSLLITNNQATIHVWATTSSSTVNS